ncbi:hypothetical protein Dda_6024 [Drechslerella dactyloides]|uniref:Uncharacterized protein n=1 Tax=Drechslerella dactyloides TaxID=74499 RepID=A0AAD6IVI3_DREDA|nr:hypothetical protein Dda_6024 [Drechslerella dactyloides]
MFARANVYTLAHLLVLAQLLANVSAWWDNVAFRNGFYWFARKNPVLNSQARDQTIPGECVVLNDAAKKQPLDGFIVWNRPQEPATMAIAIYPDTRCGQTAGSDVRGPPLAAMVLGRSVLRGLHVADFKQLDDLAQPARIRSTVSKSWRGVRIDGELGRGGIFRGIPRDRLEGSIVYWANDNRREYHQNALQWYNGIPYEGLTDRRYIQMFLREVLETAVNPQARVPELSGTLMRVINGMVGIEGDQLYLPAPEPGTDLRLNAELRVGYGLPDLDNITDEDLDQENQEEVPPIIDIVEENGDNGAPEVTLNNNLNEDVLPDGTVRYTVQLPTGDVLEFINGRGRIIPATELNAVPAPGDEADEIPNLPPTQQVTTEMADELATALDDILERPLQQSLVPAAATAVIDSVEIPLDGLHEIWDTEADKDGLYAALEGDVIQNMGSLLVARDIFRRYEESRQGLPLGTLGHASLEYRDIDAVDHLPTLQVSFQAADDKLVWYKMTEMMQQWNVATFRILRQWYGDWAANRETQERDPSSAPVSYAGSEVQSAVNIPELLDSNGEIIIQPSYIQEIPALDTEQELADFPPVNIPQRPGLLNQPVRNILLDDLSPFQRQDLLQFDPEFMSDLSTRIFGPDPNANANAIPAGRRRRNRQPLPPPDDEEDPERVVEQISEHSSDFETPTSSGSQEVDDYTPGSGGTSTVVDQNEDEADAEYFEDQHRLRHPRQNQGDL